MSADFVSYLLSFPPSEKESNLEYFKQAQKYTNELRRPAYQDTFLKGAGTQQDVLELLDPSLNTIGYALALVANIGPNGLHSKTVPDHHKPGGPFWKKMTRFLDLADPVQLRFIGEEWKTVVLYVEHVARKEDTLAVAIPPIRSALFRLDPTTGTFTSIHVRFVELCLEARAYALAVPILDNYIHSLPVRPPKNFQTKNLEFSVPAAELSNSAEYIQANSGHSEPLDLASLQRYYVLGAMAYIGVRDFKSARDFLEHVLVTPCDGTVASGLMVEAYKKWTVLNCLVDGKPQSLPRTTNSMAAKSLKSVAKAYDAVAEAFIHFADMSKLRSQVNAGESIWEEDGNAALVRELIDYQTRFYITSLSQTYSALPVSNISDVLKSSEDELLQYLETLIRDGYLNAQIDRTSKPELGVVLRFFLDTRQGPLAKSEKQQHRALHEQTVRTKTLADQVKNADYLLSVSKEHVDYVRRQSKKAAAGMMGSKEDMEMEEGLDEDIMGS